MRTDETKASLSSIRVVKPDLSENNVNWLLWNCVGFA
jgi:hypothetical protein